MEKIHRYHPQYRIARQLFKGATLIRALFNETVKAYSLSGSILDLGSKSSGSSYYKYIKIEDESNITFTDLCAGEGVTMVDVEEKLPFEDNSFDIVLAFHLFEHVYKYQVSVSEVYRILKPQGKFIVSMPFMHKYHADPADYFRMTDEAVVRVWEEGGLQCESVEYVGEGIYTYFLTTMVRFRSDLYLSRMMQGLMYLIASPVDRIINRLQNKKNNKTTAQQYALEHVVVFTK